MYDFEVTIGEAIGFLEIAPTQWLTEKRASLSRERASIPVAAVNNRLSSHSRRLGLSTPKPGESGPATFFLSHRTSDTRAQNSWNRNAAWSLSASCSLLVSHFRRAS